MPWTIVEKYRSGNDIRIDCQCPQEDGPIATRSLVYGFPFFVGQLWGDFRSTVNHEAKILVDAWNAEPQWQPLPEE